MTLARLRTGRIGEDHACELLTSKGFRVVARNCRTQAGEIDVVATEGRTLVFVEVKTMRTGSRSGPERPELAVGPRKQLQVRRLARAWLAEHSPPRYASIRFDVVGVRLDPGDSALSITHLANAF
jgi:putative endonuclease